MEFPVAGLANGQNPLLTSVADAQHGTGGLDNAAEHGTSFRRSQVAMPCATGPESFGEPGLALDLCKASQAQAWKPIVLIWEMGSWLAAIAELTGPRIGARMSANCSHL